MYGEENECGVDGLPAAFSIPENLIIVGAKLAEPDSSYICKIANNLNGFMKIERVTSSYTNSFFTEAKILNDLNPLNISPKVYWVGEVRQKPVLVFEYLHGMTFED